MTVHEKMPPSNLPIVELFDPPFEKWDTRRPSMEEMLANGSPNPVRTQLSATISDAIQAASFIARVGADNGLSNHIQSNLEKSSAYMAWQRAMPSKTPSEISRYQKDYANSDHAAIDQEISSHGLCLADGQSLFHGGLWPGGASHTTRRPLSTSLCPQVALRNAEHKGKAYDANRLDLWVLRSASSMTPAFVFKRVGTNLGHESEVLFKSGMTLALSASTLIRSDYVVSKYNCPSKLVPIYVLEIVFS